MRIFGSLCQAKKQPENFSSANIFKLHFALMKEMKLTFVAHVWFSEWGPSQPGSPTIPFMHFLTRKMIPPPHDTAHCDHAFHWFQVGHSLSGKHNGRVKHTHFNQCNSLAQWSATTGPRPGAGPCGVGYRAVSFFRLSALKHFCNVRFNYFRTFYEK